MTAAAEKRKQHVASPTNKDLFLEYQKTRSIELRNKLVERHLYLVDILVKKYVNKGVDYEDLYQVGSMALVFAVERYDPGKGFEFTSFATPTIIGEIKRYFRDKGWAMKVPRRLKEISAQVNNAKEELTNKMGHTPRVADLAAYLGYTEEEILEAMESGRAYGTYSLSQTFEDNGDEGEASVFDKYAALEDRGFDNFENAELIKSVLDKLSQEEKDVFQMRFLENKTQQEIAERQKVSQMTISRMEKKLKERFREEYYK